jgi:ABC-type multidrug transport system ATPase subunit
MTAIAMFSSPQLVMLDEASAGVDPFSRRRLWRTIRD